MAVNKARPHVFVLPEDDANLQLATEFLAEIDFSRQRQMYILNVANGWESVLAEFVAVHIAEMDRCVLRFMILLIDFDGKNDRLDRAKSVIPDRLNDRVFVLGVRTEPEDLPRAGLGPPRHTGAEMAKDCREGTNKHWGHDLLCHNAEELNRLRKHVRSILF